MPSYQQEDNRQLDESHSWRAVLRQVSPNAGLDGLINAPFRCSALPSSGSLEEIGIVDLQGGRPYQLLVRYQYISQAGQNAVFSSNYRGGVRFGVAPKKAVEEFISEAVTVAKSVDVVLLFVGLNGGG